MSRRIDENVTLLSLGSFILMFLYLGNISCIQMLIFLISKVIFAITMGNIVFYHLQQIPYLIVFSHGQLSGCGLHRYRCGYSPFCNILFNRILCRREVMSMSDYEILIIILRMIDIICDILIEYHKNNCAHKEQWTQYKQKKLL